MADVRPFRALRYAPGLDLAAAVCPPFDIISPDQQRALHERSSYNAIHVELADNSDGRRYERAAKTLAAWRSEGTLRQDRDPAFYVYDQRFDWDGKTYIRRAVFARVRLAAWEEGVVLPHEQTFGGPKEDRLQLLRAIRTNTSPVFLIYRDRERQIGTLLAQAAVAEPAAEVAADDGQRHTLWRVDDPAATAALISAFGSETLYVADGHHRYETALGYRDECRKAATQWTGEEPENFVFVALAAAADPGLLVLPIHRVTAAEGPLQAVLQRLGKLFVIERVSSLETLATRISELGVEVPGFGLVSAESDNVFLLTVADREAIDSLMPKEQSASWRRLGYAIANYAILQHGLALEEARMSDYNTLWFTEDAGDATKDVREGPGRYAVLMNPVPVGGVLDVADAGERMPQKSTFFYPKMPTGLVFNPLDG